MEEQNYYNDCTQFSPIVVVMKIQELRDDVYYGTFHQLEEKKI